MPALVLGGTRFIGLHLVHELLRRGQQVAVLNRGKTEAELPPEVERLFGDRNDPASIRAALAGREFDNVFDISGYTREQLAPAVEALAGRVGRYVFCSTMATYTYSDVFPIAETQPFTDAPMQFEDYSNGKVACERHLLERWSRDRFPFTSLRPVMVYGPHNSTYLWELSHFARLRRGLPILVPGDGKRIMQFVHVDDLVDAFANVPETGSSLGQAYNMAGSEAVSMTGYVELLARVVGVEPEIVFVEEAGETGQPSSFPFIWRRSGIFDIAKARRDLSFDPRPMLAGLEETYRWYLAENLDEHPWDFSAEDALLERIRAGVA